MSRKLLFILRWGIFALACWYIWHGFADERNLSAFAFITSMEGQPLWVFGGLGFVLALMFLNWYLEAAKWKLLLSDLQPMSRRRALAATFAGASISLLTPNRTGEFVGRVFFVRPEVRIDAAALTVLGNLAQVLATLVLGTLALAIMVWMRAPLPVPAGWALSAVAFSALLLSAVAFVLYLSPGLLRQVIEVIPYLRRYDSHFKALDNQPRSRLAAVLGLGVLRYGVFSLQFFILLTLFVPGIGPVHAMLAIPVVFLLTTLVPTVMLTELGVRNSATIALMQPLGGAITGIATATTILWTVNVLLPALIGSVALALVRSKADVQVHLVSGTEVVVSGKGKSRH